MTDDISSQTASYVDTVFPCHDVIMGYKAILGQSTNRLWRLLSFCEQEPNIRRAYLSHFETSAL